MYAKLKQDMRSAGVAVSEGDDLATSDLQLARDFLYFNGINIGEEFHRYEEVVHGSVAAVAPADTSTDGTIVGGDGADDSDANEADDSDDNGEGDVDININPGEADQPPAGDVIQDQETDQDQSQDVIVDQAPGADQAPGEEQA